jgi:ABC-type branched-subunit amino acid transport system ATPase component
LARHPDGFISEFKERASRRRAARLAAGAAAVPATLAATGVVPAVETPASAERQPTTMDKPAAMAERAAMAEPAAAAERLPTTVDLGSHRAPARDTGPAEPISVAGDGRGPATLELVGVSAGYGQSRVLYHTDIALRPGCALGLLGANGAGKSTLCKVAGGLLAPTEGTVLFEGEDITARAPFWRSRQGLVLAPEARSVFPNLTVEENLRLQVHDRATREGVLDRWPILAARRKVAAGLLSGGEQRLLAIAPLLFEPPKVLIADEPSLGLAPRFVTEVFTLLEELRRQGVALLVVEEKMRDIVAFADEIAVMELGRIELVIAADAIDANRLAARYLHAASGTG